MLECCRSTSATTRPRSSTRLDLGRREGEGLPHPLRPARHQARGGRGRGRRGPRRAGRPRRPRAVRVAGPAGARLTVTPGRRFQVRSATSRSCAASLPVGLPTAAVPRRTARGPRRAALPAPTPRPGARPLRARERARPHRPRRRATRPPRRRHAHRRRPHPHHPAARPAPVPPDDPVRQNAPEGRRGRPRPRLRRAAGAADWLPDERAEELLVAVRRPTWSKGPPMTH